MPKMGPARTARVAAHHRQLSGDPRLTEAEQARHDRTAGRLEKSLQTEGRCVKCGRTLTDPVSVDAGIGPDCRTKGAA